MATILTVEFINERMDSLIHICEDAHPETNGLLTVTDKSNGRYLFTMYMLIMDDKNKQETEELLNSGSLILYKKVNDLYFCYEIC